MENKYYTPEIEEFHIGLEYEEKSSGLWTKQKYDEFSPIINKELCKYDTIQGYINNKIIRVKCLDKEDIESFGFKLALYYNEDNATYSLNTIHDTFIWFYINYEYHCVIERQFHTNSKCKPISKGERETIFNGYIKNKSELNKLLKQLGINDKI